MSQREGEREREGERKRECRQQSLPCVSLMECDAVYGLYVANSSETLLHFLWLNFTLTCWLY